MKKAAKRPKKKKRPVNSRRKGKEGEREWRDVLIAAGFTARRGQQFRGGADQPDVVCEELDGKFHPEVKFSQDVPKQVYVYMEQAVAERPSSAVPYVAMRRSRAPWLVVLLASDWVRIMGVEARLAAAIDEARRLRTEHGDALERSRGVQEDLRKRAEAAEAKLDEANALLERQRQQLVARDAKFARGAKLADQRIADLERGGL